MIQNLKRGFQNWDDFKNMAMYLPWHAFHHLVGWFKASIGDLCNSKLVSHAKAQQRSDNLPRHDDAPGPPEGGHVVFPMY